MNEVILNLIIIVSCIGGFLAGLALAWFITENIPRWVATAVIAIILVPALCLWFAWTLLQIAKWLGA